MNAQDQQRLRRIATERITRARELIAIADLLGITIGWERDGSTSFTPASECPPRLIEEVTILTREVRGIKEGRITFDKNNQITIKK